MHIVNRAKKLFIAVAICYLPFAFFGCAQAPTTTVALDSGLLNQAFSVRNLQYVPLVSVCDIYGFKSGYDPVSGLVNVKKGNLKIVLALNGSYCIVNDKLEHLDGPVIFYNGIIALPRGFTESIVRRFLMPAKEISARVAPGKISIGTIIIDAGHGGKDPGAIGKKGLREKEVNLGIALALKNKLEAEGIKAVLTRSSDRFISLYSRADIANKKRADIFVSVHSNSSKQRDASGFEVYCLADAADEGSQDIARFENAALNFDEGAFALESNDTKAIIWDLMHTENRIESLHLGSYICKSMSKLLSTKIRGVKGAPFYVLKGTDMTAVLVEVGFISNPAEESKLRDQNYRDRLAQGICDGIMSYKKEFERTNGFTN